MTTAALTLNGLGRLRLGRATPCCRWHPTALSRDGRETPRPIDFPFPLLLDPEMSVSGGWRPRDHCFTISALVSADAALFQGQQLGNAIDPLIRDKADDLSQIAFAVKAVKLGFKLPRKTGSVLECAPSVKQNQTAALIPLPSV